MPFSKLLALFLFVATVISGCGSETSAPESSVARQQPISSSKPDVRQSYDRGAEKESGQSGRVPDAPKVMGNPTSSELRALREAADVQEGKIQGLIKDLDANLTNPEMRKDVQKSFNEALPEYKANILSIGKAKLKTQAQSGQ